MQEAHVRTAALTALSRALSVGWRSFTALRAQPTMNREWRSVTRRSAVLPLSAPLFFGVPVVVSCFEHSKSGTKLRPRDSLSLPDEAIAVPSGNEKSVVSKKRKDAESNIPRSLALESPSDDAAVIVVAEIGLLISFRQSGVSGAGG